MLPQLIYLVLVALGCGIAINEHGTPRTGNHNCIGHFIGISIGFALLYWGGFWDVLLGL
jgi:hypothetical protein